MPVALVTSNSLVNDLIKEARGSGAFQGARLEAPQTLALHDMTIPLVSSTSGFWWRSKVARISAPKIPGCFVGALGRRYHPTLATLSHGTSAPALAPFLPEGDAVLVPRKGDLAEEIVRKIPWEFQNSENSFTQSAHLSGYVGQSASTSIRTATCKIHSRAQRRTGRDVIATHHDPRGGVGKLDFLHCYMLISCSLKSCWQRLLVQVGRRILKRLERTNLYNIYNHVSLYLYIHIYIYPFPQIPKLPATLHCCSSVGKEMTWIRIFMDFPGMSVETDFWEAPLSTTIPSKAWTEKTRFSPGQSMTSSSAISSKINGFRSPLHT